MYRDIAAAQQTAQINRHQGRRQDRRQRIARTWRVPRRQEIVPRLQSALALSGGKAGIGLFQMKNCSGVISSADNRSSGR